VKGALVSLPLFLTGVRPAFVSGVARLREWGSTGHASALDAGVAKPLAIHTPPTHFTSSFQVAWMQAALVATGTGRRRQNKPLKKKHKTALAFCLTKLNTKLNSQKK
jgi:hypothetical protein